MRIYENPQLIHEIVIDVEEKLCDYIRLSAWRAPLDNDDENSNQMQVVNLIYCLTKWYKNVIINKK